MHSTHPGSKPSPSRVRAAIRLAAVALVSLVGAGFGASACLNRPLCDKDCQPKTTNIFVDAIQQKSVDKIDLLFMIDNSISMADKQTVLKDAVPDLVKRLVSPNCVDPETFIANKQMTPDDPMGDCPGALIREFTPIRNIHVGIVSSSIGGHGSQTLCLGNDGGSLKDQEENDHAWLMGKRPRNGPFTAPAGGVAPDPQGFLNWNPDEMKGETSAQFTATFQAMTTWAGEFGCGLESQLEAIYRFLVDPNPYNTIVVQSCPGSTEPCAVPQGRDDNLLAQRKAFLRPDSLVAIIMMTDENDCSIQESGQYYYAARDNIILPHGSAICATNPNDKCCYFCNSQPPAGCEDPTCSMGTLRTQDQPNLRCFHQKQRFGFDFLYPTQRYVNALTQTQICTSRSDLAPDPTSCRDLDGDKKPDIFDNPLYVGANGSTAVPRDQTLVFLAGIVGVPWQDLKTDTRPDGTPYPNANELHYRTAAQLGKDNIWSVILGDDNPSPMTMGAPIPPSDSLMIESKDPRAGMDGETPPQALAGTEAARRANPVNGHEWKNTDQDDLQYACIFDLAQTRNCADEIMKVPAPGCDCKPGKEGDNNPLCQGANGQYSTVQNGAKAYPGLRELKVLKDFGNNSIVASICARNLKDANAQDYGYRPAVDAIVDRLKEALTGKCLPRTLTPDPITHEIPCSIIEVRPTPPTGGDLGCMAPGREPAPDGVKEPVKSRLHEIGFCGVPNKPSCDGGQIYFCKIKESTGPDSNCNKNESPNDTGWCYVDPSAPGHEEDDQSLVAKCPATQQRIIRFVDPMTATPAHDATVLIACFGSSLPAE